MTPIRWAAACTLASALTAAPARAETIWLCGLSDDVVRLVCIADDDMLNAVNSPVPQITRVNGTAFPLDRAKTWVVDLWSPPDDPSHVDLLARATICYRSPGCTVVLTPFRRGTRAPSTVARR